MAGLRLAHSHFQNAPTKFTRKNHFPEITSGVDKVLSLFHRYAYIYRPFTGQNWFSANEKWKLGDTEILKAIACEHPKNLLGARAGKTSRFAVLDIDHKSKYHNKKELDRIVATLASAGISKYTLYRSSYNNGWHLYIFFNEQIRSKELHDNLQKLLTLNNFVVEKGQLEIFPNVSEGSVGMGLRLPMQPGFAWLNKNTLEVIAERQELKSVEALDMFVQDLEDANTYQNFLSLKRYIEQVYSKRSSISAMVKEERSTNVAYLNRKVNVDATGNYKYKEEVASIFYGLPPGIHPDNWYRGREYYELGLTGESQRADAIFCLSHYLFYGDPSKSLPALGYGAEQEREWAIKEILQAKHHGCSKEINKNRSDAIAQAVRAANWRPAHQRGAEIAAYKRKQPIAWIRGNAKREANARKRIIDVLEQLKKEGRSFSLRDLKTLVKCSTDTLYKHQDLWKPVQAKLQMNRLANDPGKYNVVLGEGSSETLPSKASIQKNMPAGRLAAKRILHEINMRAERTRKETVKAQRLQNGLIEKQWIDKVNQLIPKDIQSIATIEIKARISVLQSLLATAPSEEDLLVLKGHIDSFARELAIRDSGPLRTINSVFTAGQSISTFFQY